MGRLPRATLPSPPMGTPMGGLAAVAQAVDPWPALAAASTTV